jgi:hypothetical protein
MVPDLVRADAKPKLGLPAYPKRGPAAAKGKETVMRRSLRAVLALATVSASLVLVTSASAGFFDSTLLVTSLNGQEEVDAGGVPGQGDLDGRGVAAIRIDTDSDEVCWTIAVRGIELPAAAAHIHQAVAGVNGAIVVTLSPPTSPSKLLERLNLGVSRGCTTSAFADAIVADPDGFYVNVHNTPFPNGALRGQLD